MARKMQFHGFRYKTVVAVALILFSISSVHSAEVRVGMLRAVQGIYGGTYSGAFQSLLAHIRQETLTDIVPEPVEIQDFNDERIFSLPFIYSNYSDRDNWDFSEEETKKLREYFIRGGLLFIDAGITASFLREQAYAGQHHSFPEWDACPELKTAFKKVFPDADFQPLKRSDPLFRAFYQGLPDTTLLPESVRDYTKNEKWPDGTYSTVVLRVNGRPAVIATPILSMGWGKNSLGQWITRIQFRVLEDTDGLTDYVKNAAYSGARFEVAREDGGKDVVYCQSEATPSWNHEPSGRSRIFRNYGSPEINDFAHVFYTRLGTNIVIYALTR